MVAGSVPAANLGALASFLLTGQSSRDVKDRTPDVPRQPPPRLVAAAAPAAVAPRVDATPADRKGAAAAPSAPVTARTTGGVDPGKSSPTPAVASAPASRSAPPSLVLAPPRDPPRDPLGGALGKPARGWMRPTAIGSGVAALALGALALQQGMVASSASEEADAMLDGDLFRPGADRTRYERLRADADAARKNTYLSAGFAAAFATAAGVLGWMSWDRSPDPGALVAFTF